MKSFVSTRELIKYHIKRYFDWDQFIRYFDKEGFVKCVLKNPIVSFTFDDFPKSACITAGNILKKYNIHATYYASFGLMNLANDLGELFSLDDLKELIADGNEIGCHTFSHIGDTRLPCLEYEKNVLKNNEQAKELLGGYKLNNFAYPCGNYSR